MFCGVCVPWAERVEYGVLRNPYIVRVATAKRRHWLTPLPEYCMGLELIGPRNLLFAKAHDLRDDVVRVLADNARPPGPRREKVRRLTKLSLLLSGSFTT